MKKDFFKTNYFLGFICWVCFFSMPSCNNNADKNTQANDAKDDTIHYTGNNKTDNKPADKFTSADEAARAERQGMILMQIDSTYNAISLLDDAKTELTDLSPAELTVAERNKKSKAIFNINIIQNELTRALDASILSNLRIRTDELVGITADMEKNITHLKSVTVKLNKATLCIGRLTNILAMCLSKGIIKPITPRGASVVAVKAAVN